MSRSAGKKTTCSMFEHNKKYGTKEAQEGKCNDCQLLKTIGKKNFMSSLAHSSTNAVVNFNGPQRDYEMKPVNRCSYPSSLPF